MASDKRAEGRSVEAHEALSRAFCSVTEGQDWVDWDGLTNTICAADMQHILAHHGWVLVGTDELARLREAVEAAAEALDRIRSEVGGCIYLRPCAEVPDEDPCAWCLADAALARLSPLDPRPEQPA